MSNDRINGMIWGFNIGWACASAIYTTPYMILWAAISLGASFLFAQHNARATSGERQDG